ncbi:MAG: hypothetical protein KIS96_03515 [Bauldia sp.]|nr:hypothetical protein [Bauldia sp.]
MARGERPLTLAVVTYLYRGAAGYRAEHANILRRMVARHLSVPHAFWCVGDDPSGLDPEVRFHPCDASLLPLSGCYVKLEMWKREAGFFGSRILLLDLDTIIVGSLDELVARPEPVVLYRDPLFGRAEGWLYNGAFVLMEPGARPEVWESFDPKSSPAAVKASGLRLHDQAWLGMVLGPDMPVVTAADGVLSFKHDGVRELGAPPPHARIVFFHGRPKPWQVDSAWIAEHYR